MNAGERLEAAIAKLEAFRDWEVPHSVQGAVLGAARDASHRGDPQGVAGAHLIVKMTDKQMCDAQLAILRHAAADPISPDEPGALGDALALADAILGEQS